MKPFRRSTFWEFLVGFILSITGLGWNAWGATYNFYLNSTEQGNNSTATPTLTVSEGKATKTGGDSPTPNLPASSGSPNSPTRVTQASPISPEIAVEAPTPVTPPAAGTPQTAPGLAAQPPVTGLVPPSNTPLMATNMAKADLLDARSTIDFHPWKMGLSVTLLKSLQPHTSVTPGAVASLSYSINPELAVNVFAGAGEANWVASLDDRFIGGAEIQIIPIRLSLLRMDDFLDLGIILGGSNLGAVHENNGAIHAGARLNINLGKSWGISAVGRGNFGFALAEAGLQFRI